MSKNDGFGCGYILVCILGVLMILYVIGGFIANLHHYDESGSKTSANAAMFFFLLICGIGWLLYKFFGKK